MFGRIFCHVRWSIFLGGWRFWKVNNRRFKEFRVSIVMAHEKFPTFAYGTRSYFLFLHFWKCQCSLLSALTCEPYFIIINKNDHFIQILYWFWDYSNFVTTILMFLVMISSCCWISKFLIVFMLVWSNLWSSHLNCYTLVSLKPQMWILLINSSLKNMLVFIVTLHHYWSVGLIVLVYIK